MASADIFSALSEGIILFDIIKHLVSYKWFVE
jgi:hypothetical protein